MCITELHGELSFWDSEYPSANSALIIPFGLSPTGKRHEKYDHIYCLCPILGMSFAVVPKYLPASSENVDKTIVIVEYFKQGFKYNGILGFSLLKQGILLSLSLKRIPRKLSLIHRCMHLDTMKNAVRVLIRELQSSR